MNVTVVNTGDANQSVTIADDDALITALKKDGLITGDVFTIDVDHGVLKVNGKEVDICRMYELTSKHGVYINHIKNLYH